MTRITLTLHEFSDPQEIVDQRETIIQQFKDLPQTLLLFLKKLKRIEIIIYDDNYTTVSSSTTYSSQYDEEHNRAVLSKEYRKGDIVKQDIKNYFVTKKQVHGLAKNENRTYTEEEEEKRSYSTAEVILAFPVSATAEPVIEHQDVFAFLPIRDFGFKVY
jgi:hypothetical protein